MDISTVKVGFIGAGAFISSRHLPTAAEADFIDIRAIADLNERLLAAHTETYHPGYTTTDYKRLLQDPEIDLVVIGTRQDTHARLIIEALDAGKWVWCEKPMCETPDEEAAVLAAEKKAQGKLAIGFNRRFAPAITKIMGILRQQPQPWIFSYRLQSKDGYKTPSKGDGFYVNRSHVIYEGCHILDLASFMIGEAPSKVYMSVTGNDNDIITMEYPCGARFNLIMTSTAGAISLEKEAMEIFTPKGAITMRDFVEVRVRDIEGEQDQLFVPQRCPFGNEILRWGYDFWQQVWNRLVWEDESPTQHIYHIALPQTEQPFEAYTEKIVQSLKSKSWQERNFAGDKGWIGAFLHFAQACRNKTTPVTADGAAGRLANEIGFALLKSAEIGKPVEFKA